MSQKLKNVTLKDFELRRTLGTGSFGRVRLVTHKQTGKVYALKIISKYETLKLKQVQHITAEKNILAQVSHPFLVNYVASFQDKKRLYIVLEYVVGGEFFTHLRKAGRFPNDIARIFVAEVVLALGYLHSMDIVYRDLKPENLLLSSTGHIKITDFGFAKKVDYKTWTLCGTPEYLAPEIILSKGHTKGVDWWAVGVLIFELLAGYPPFYDEEPIYIYQKILEGKIVFPWHFDKQAKDVIKRLLQPDITKRLGCMANGVEDIKMHKWFKGLDWKELEQMSGAHVKGPVPIEVRAPDDTSNFDPYPETDSTPRPIDEKDQELFARF